MSHRSIFGAEAPGRHRWLFRAVLVVAGVGLGVVLAEIGLRTLGLAPPPGLFTVTEAEYQRIPGIFAPNQRATANPGTRFEHVTTINALGYRGSDFPREKPPGQVRVLFAGDSFTWGHNVDDDATTPARLQANLEARCVSAVVANAGMSGTTILAHEAMISRGLAIDPDVVILMYHENDIDELIYSRMWEQLSANRRTKSRFPLSLVYPVVRTSALWNLAQDARRRFHFRKQDTARTRDVARDAQEDSESESVQRARAEYRVRLEAIGTTLADTGIPFLFVTYPHPNSVTAGEGGRDYAWVTETARELGLSVLDLLPLLRNGPLTVEQAYLIPDDYHPSEAGHAFAATVIADYMTGEFGDTLSCAGAI